MPSFILFQVSDFESARKYSSKYLSVRENSSTAWKVHGQACDALGQGEKALSSFKTALELDPSQKELILKIVDLFCRLQAKGNKVEEGKAR